MAENAASFLGAWSNFYVMIGSSAAALTGLMFVVISLASGEKGPPSSSDGIGTFSTPTVLHFCAAFIVAATLSAPWHALLYPGILIGVMGLAGALYTLRIMYRAATRLTTYRPDLEDWCWFWILPLLAFGAILAAGIMLTHAPASALFLTGAGVVLLIIIGIRNAWDVVTYLAITVPEGTKK